MEKYILTLQCASLFATGATLALLGYRMLTFNIQLLMVELFALLGCAAGAHFNSVPLAAGGGIAGALLGYWLSPRAHRAALAFTGLTVGFVLGYLLSIPTHYSRPFVLASATGIGCAVIVLLDPRVTMVIGSSAVGGMLAALGCLFSVVPGRLDALLTRPNWEEMFVMGGILALLFAVGGAIFQFRTTKDPAPVRKPSPRPAPTPLPAPVKA